MLQRKSFVVHSKLVKDIATKEGAIIHKANCDVELTMDVMQTYNKFDTILLLSGDSDFLPLVAFLQEAGKRVIIISRRGHVAREMVKNADMYLHFDQFKPFWSLESQNPGLSRGSWTFLWITIAISDRMSSEIFQFENFKKFPELVQGISTTTLGNMSFNWGEAALVRKIGKSFSLTLELIKRMS